MKVKDVLIQCGVPKTLKGRPNPGTFKELSCDGGLGESNDDSNKGYER